MPLSEHRHREKNSGYWYLAQSRAIGLQQIANTPAASQRSIFNADGDVIGDLKLLCTDSGMTGQAFALAGAAVKAAARAIEERSFCKRRQCEWIMALAPGEPVGHGMLLAVDHRQRVIEHREMTGQVDQARPLRVHHRAG
jgi:transcriptional regulator of acetoin/glycerol metabolism